jgi:hypothetical protein
VPYLVVRDTDGALSWSPASTLASIAPALTTTIGAGGPLYSAQVAATSPAPVAPGCLVDATVNGQRMTVIVKAPVTTHTYHVPPIGAGQDPIAYFAGAVLIRYVVNSSAAIVLGTASEADDVTFRQVTLTSSPGAGFFLQHGRGSLIDDCPVTRSNGRPISLFADAVHVDGAVSGDVIIENSTFAYQGDDGVQPQHADRGDRSRRGEQPAEAA